MHATSSTLESPPLIPAHRPYGQPCPICENGPPLTEVIRTKNPELFVPIEGQEHLMPEIVYLERLWHFEALEYDKPYPRKERSHFWRAEVMARHHDRYPEFYKAYRQRRCSTDSRWKRPC